LFLRITRVIKTDRKLLIRYPSGHKEIEEKALVDVKMMM